MLIVPASPFASYRTISAAGSPAGSRAGEGRRPGRWGRLLLGGLALFGASSCTSINLFTLNDDRQIGADNYPQLLAEEPVAQGGADTARVTRIFERLLGVMEDPGFEWEVRVINNDAVVNAWCLPGGKMAVYTGILQVAQSDDEVATVMGHEMAHALARHGTERMTLEILTESGVGLLFGEAREGAQYAALGASLLGLKYSRKNELEADRLGFFAMARAGYDPRAAPQFWRRMAELGGGGGWELLSTHPSDERRIQQLEELMDEAIAQGTPAP